MRSVSALLLALGMVVGCAEATSPEFVDRGVCDVLIDCAATAAPEFRDAYALMYGPEGTCWKGGPAEWQTCRDACESTLDALNEAAMAGGGASCGSCTADADCTEYGAGAQCEDGYCVGVSADEGGSESNTDADAGSETGDCFQQTEECARMIDCFAVILPEQDVSEFESGGSCWCGSEQEAQDCHDVCVQQLDVAIEQNPTLGVCHGRHCPLAELDPDEPYGPPPCAADELEMNNLPVPGTYCAQTCSGVAQICPQHSQTVAQGSCSWTTDPLRCGLRCYVDPYKFPSGNQCQCGAVCRPYGTNDGDGNARGFCTFDE